MRKNEPLANRRMFGPIPFYDVDGKLKTGLSFAAAGASAIWDVDSLAFTDTTNDPVEQGTSGKYYIQGTQAETNHDSFLTVRLRNAAGDDSFIDIPIDNTADVNLVSTNGVPVAPDDGKGAGGAIYKVPASRTITTGTETGVLADAFTEDLVWHQIATAGAVIDFKYTFVRANSIAAHVFWVGFVNDPDITINVFAYNWVTLAWDQIGTVIGQDVPSPGTRAVWPLEEDHTKNDGTVEIRFQQTLINSELFTDRIMVGYLPTKVDANLVENLGVAVPPLVSGRFDVSIGEVQAVGGPTVQSAVAIRTVQVLALGANTIDFHLNGQMGGEANEVIAANTIIGMTIVLECPSRTVLDGSYPQTRRVTNWVDLGGNLGRATVDRDWDPTPTGTPGPEGPYRATLWPAGPDIGIAGDVTAILALLHQNAMVDNQTYSGNDLTGFRLRKFANPAALAAATPGAADGADGEIYRFIGTATYVSAGKADMFKIEQVFP